MTSYKSVVTGTYSQDHVSCSPDYVAASAMLHSERESSRLLHADVS